MKTSVWERRERQGRCGGGAGEGRGLVNRKREVGNSVGGRRDVSKEGVREKYRYREHPREREGKGNKKEEGRETAEFRVNGGRNGSERKMGMDGGG